MRVSLRAVWGRGRGRKNWLCFGFDWVCFDLVGRGFGCRKPLYYKGLESFLGISRLGLNWVRFGFVWVRFEGENGRFWAIYSRKVLRELELWPDYPYSHWLCFA